jgi:hypothetical protein
MFYSLFYRTAGHHHNAPDEKHEIHITACIGPFLGKHPIYRKNTSRYNCEALSGNQTGLGKTMINHHIWGAFL